jgi:hypothetical protein
MEAWLWLLDDESLIADAPWGQYGAGTLAVICQKYGFSIPGGESVDRMIRGELCHPDCQEGCGR